MDNVFDQRNKILEKRWPKDYFAGMDFQTNVTKEMEESTKHVFECASEIRKRDSDMLNKLVSEGSTQFRKKEFEIAKLISDQITREDLKSGVLKPWQLRIMKKMEGLAFWTPSELE